MSRFEKAVAQFSEIIRGLHKPDLTPMEAMNSFHGWMGQVQRVLAVANQDLSDQLASLRSEGVDTLEAVQEFGSYQMSMAEALDEIGEILKGCNSVHAFLEAEPRLAVIMEKIEGAASDLEMLLDGEPEEEPGPGPLPDSIRECLDRVEQALQHIVRYAEVRNHEDLLELSEQLDLAQEALADFLEDDD